jgi:hypothetical protein
MKELAEFIRFLTPFLSDIQRYKYISGVHLYFQIFLVIVFFVTKNIIIKIVVLVIITFSIFLELCWKDCPITILEREFHSETWDDILDIIFKTSGWTITRSEKIVGFTCFNVGILISFSLFTLYEFGSKMYSSLNKV